MIKPRKAVMETAAYILPDRSRKHKIRMDHNENNWGCSPKVVEALKNINVLNISVYPEYEKLINKLSKHLGVPFQNVIVTNGSDDGIRSIIETYIEKGSEVVIPVPTFTIFPQYFKLKQAEIVEIPYHNDLSFPVKEILNAITDKTSMIVIVNPNSPTGTLIQRDELIKVLQSAKNAIVVLDEAYSHYARTTNLQLVRDFSNLFVLQTFSKAYGLAGLRLGYVISAKENIENLRKVILPYSVNTLAVIAGSAALDDQGHLQKVINEMEGEKEFLYSELEKLGIETHRTETNFILAKTGKWTDRISQKLKNKDILVKNLKSYPLLEGFCRITVGRREENQKLIESLKEVVPPQAILFDMDGVLVDVSDSYRMAIKKTAEFFLEKEISLIEIQEYKNKGGYNNDWDLTEAILNSYDKKIEMEKIVERFQMFYLGKNFDGLVQNEKWLLDRNILHELKRHYKLGIVTGRPRQEAEYVLRRFGLDSQFDVLITLEDTPGPKMKPDPHGINLAMKKLTATRAFYVGDTVDDVKAAVDAGITPVSVVEEGGALNSKSLKEYGAQHIIGSVNEILEILA